MNNDRRDGYGEYFGSFSSASGPRNLTSDMWAPISSDNNYIANTGAVPRDSAAQGTAKTQSTERPKKAETPAPESPYEKKKKSVKKPKTAKKEKATAKPQQSSTDVKSDKESGKKAGSKATAPGTRKKEDNKRKKQKNIQKLRKDKARYASLIKNGKSIDEARRIMSERKVRKRKLSTLLSVLTAFVFAFCICFVYCYYEGAPIKTIVVKGDNVYTQEEIVSAAEVLPGQSMLTVREDEVNRRVLSKLPFVSGISLNYVFPEILEMDVVSTREHFIIKNGNKYVCVDKNGKIVSVKKKKVEKDQFLVIGPEFENAELGAKFEPLQSKIGEDLSEDEKLRLTEKNDFEMKRYNTMLEVSALCEKYGVITGGKLDLSDMTNIRLDYESRVRIYLGDAKNLELKIENASSIITQQVKKDQTGYVDVSYDVRNYFLAGSMDR